MVYGFTERFSNFNAAEKRIQLIYANIRFNVYHIYVEVIHIIIFRIIRACFMQNSKFDIYISDLYILFCAIERMKRNSR